MPSCATNAKYLPTLPVPNRDQVQIAGAKLKAGCVTSDVESFGKDVNGNGTPISESLAILITSPSGCTARIAHMANFAEVYVRVRCDNGEMSGWLLVAGRT
jgi:hypothetical protein